MQSIPWPTLKPKEHEAVEKVLHYWFSNELQDVYSPQYSFQRYLWFEGGEKIDKQIEGEFFSNILAVGFDIIPQFLDKLPKKDFELAKKSLSLEVKKANIRDGKIPTEVEDIYQSLTTDQIVEFLKREAKSLREKFQLSPSSIMGLIILLDQFPRNIFRGRKEMYVFADVVKPILQKLHQDLNVNDSFHENLKEMYPPTCERLFIYFAFLHYEDISFATIGLEGMEVLHSELASSKETPENTQSMMDNIYQSTKYQIDILKRFSRYPHRNKILERETKAEELEFMSQNPQPFIEFYQETDSYLDMFAHHKKIVTETKIELLPSNIKVVHKNKRKPVTPTNSYFLNFQPINVPQTYKKFEKLKTSDLFASQPDQTNKKTKLQILVLHGYKQSAASLRASTRKFAKHFVEKAEFIYIDAPFNVPDEEPNPIDIKKKLCWWIVDDNQQYEGIQHSIDYLSQIWDEKGPFDGILGQSQGGALAAILASLLYHKKIHSEEIMPLSLPKNITFKFIINVSGFASAPQSHQVMWKEQFVQIPSLHVIGERDSMVPPERTKQTASYFLNSVLSFHSGQHFSPQKWSVDDFFNFINPFYIEKVSDQNLSSSSPSSPLIGNDNNNDDEVVNEISFGERIAKAKHQQNLHSTSMFVPFGFSKKTEEILSDANIESAIATLRIASSSVQNIVDAFKTILITFFSEIHNPLNQTTISDRILEDLIFLIFSIRTKGDPYSQQRYTNFLLECYLFDVQRVLPYIMMIPKIFSWIELSVFHYAVAEKLIMMKENRSNLTSVNTINTSQSPQQTIDLLNDLYDHLITFFATQLKEDELKLSSIKEIRKKYAAPYEYRSHRVFHDIIPTSSPIDAKLFVGHLKRNGLWPSDCASAMFSIRSHSDTQTVIPRHLATKLNPLHIPADYVPPDDHDDINTDHTADDGEDEKDPLWYTKGKAYTLYTTLIRNLKAVLVCDNPIVRKNIITKQQLHQYTARVSKDVWSSLLTRPVSDDVLHPRPRPVLPCTIDDLQPLLSFLSQNTKPNLQTPFVKGTIVPDGRLDLCKQVVGPRGIAPLLESMKGNQHVSRLLLGNNIIGDHGAAEIARAIRNREVPNMNVWYLGGNEFTPVGIALMAEALESDSLVEALWLKLNPVGPLGCVSLAKMLSVNRSLVILDLVNTGILDEGFITIIDTLQSCDSPLQHLYAGSCALTEKSAERLMTFFESKRNRLISLYISTNRLGDAGAEFISRGIVHDRHLRRFSLASNRITHVGFSQLVTALVTSNHPLELLDMGYPKNTAALGELGNSIGDEGVESIVRLLENHALKSLNISNNMLSEKSVLKIADALENNFSLLALHFFQFSTKFSPAIIDRIKDLIDRNNARLSDSEKDTILELEFPKHIHDVYSVYRTKEKKSSFDPQNFDSFMH